MAEKITELARRLEPFIIQTIGKVISLCVTITCGTTGFEISGGGNSSGILSGAGNNTLDVNSSESVIAGGNGNQLTSANDSVIGGGESNIIQATTGLATDNIIGGGSSGLISDCDNAAILGGDQANIYNSDFAFIGGGYQSFIRYSAYSIVCGGNANQVDSGAGGPDITFNSFIGSGESNSIGISAGTAFYSTIVGGFGNQITDGIYGFIGGGIFNLINTPDNAVIAGGSNNLVTGDNAAILGGFYTKADKYGQQAHASGRFAAQGDAQRSYFVVRRSVTHSDANWYELFLDGSAAKMTIAVDTVWTFNILLVGTTQGCTKSFGFQINGVIENDGGTTSMLVSNITTLYDTDDTSFDARVTADNTNDALLVEVQDSDGASDVVRWVANVETAEVTFPA